MGCGGLGEPSSFTEATAEARFTILSIRNRQSAIQQISNRQQAIGNRKARLIVDEAGSKNTPGSDLLSHAVSHAVPSAVEGLTSVFGMGTGGTPLL